jgi:hypothetical protein
VVVELDDNVEEFGTAVVLAVVELGRRVVVVVLNIDRVVSNLGVLIVVPLGLKN